MTKVLVTGCFGFIGSHIVDALLEAGHSIVGVDNFLTGDRKNLNHLLDTSYGDKCLVYDADITNREKMEEIFRDNKIDYVFHLAADARLPSCTANPIATTAINVTGTLHLLELSKVNNVKGFIYSSSSSVYGKQTHQDPIPEMARLAPANIYGLQKLMGEQLALMYHKFHGLNTIALRYLNVYGTNRQREGGAYPTIFSALASAIKQDKKFFIFGDGNQKRDYIHVYDVVEANLKALDKPKSWKCWGQAYNVGTGVATKTIDVVKMFGNKYGLAPAREEDIPYSCASTWRAKNELKFEAKISLKKGVEILKESHGFENKIYTS